MNLSTITFNWSIGTALQVSPLKLLILMGPGSRTIMKTTKNSRYIALSFVPIAATHISLTLSRELPYAICPLMPAHPYPHWSQSAQARRPACSIKLFTINPHSILWPFLCRSCCEFVWHKHLLKHLAAVMKSTCALIA